MFLKGWNRYPISALILFLVVIGLIFCPNSVLAKEVDTITTKAGEKYPTKMINVVCWGKEGASCDLTTRTMSHGLEKETGQRIIVENRTGGRGANAWSRVLSQPADGYTILGATSSYCLWMAGRKKFSPDQFTPLVSYVCDPTCIYVRADSQFKNLDQLIKYAKTGTEKLDFGANIVGSTHNWHAWSFAKEIVGDTGRFRWVPYKSNKEIVMAVIGGHVDLGIASRSNVLPQYEAGKIRILAVASKNRGLGAVAKVPTFKELGYDLELYIWRGMWIRSGTPEEIVDYLHNKFRKVTKRPEVIEWRKRYQMDDFYMERQKLGKLVKNCLVQGLEYNRELGLVK